jgi:predicted hydrocarbon binding protein
MERLIRDSEKSIWLLLGKWGILHIAKTGAMREVINALERGVDVKIMGDVEQRNLNYFEEIHKDVAIRHTDNMSLQGCLVDSEVAVMSISVGTNPVGRGKEDSALIIESAEFLEAHLNLVKTVWENSIPFNSVKRRINEGVIIDPIRLSLGSGSLYQKMKEAIVEKIEDKHPQSIGWTNAILRKRGEPLPFSTEIPTFDALGIQVSEILKPIGIRIGQEIAMQFEGIKDDEIFWNELMNLWESLGMGTLNVEGNPPTYIKVDDSNACGGSPNFGKMFCHLDEGVLEGVISERFGIQVTAIERDCTAEGKPHCNFDIVF